VALSGEKRESGPRCPVPTEVSWGSGNEEVKEGVSGKPIISLREVAMCWCSFLILLAPLAAGGAPVDDAARKELANFQGSWKAVAIRHADGREASAVEVQSTRLLIEGNKFTLTVKDAAIVGKFTVNPAKSPRTIDVVLTAQDGTKTRILGIYLMQGDTRKSCFAAPGKKRPAEFSTEQGYVSFTWRRN
jgi:uncharacterized protein (TIGR03067 family)